MTALGSISYRIFPFHFLVGPRKTVQPVGVSLSLTIMGSVDLLFANGDPLNGWPDDPVDGVPLGGDVIGDIDGEVGVGGSDGDGTVGTGSIGGV